MDQDTTIIAASGWSKGDPGIEYPMRCLLVYNARKKEYASTYQTRDPDTGMVQHEFWHHGYYKKTFEEALQEYIVRLSKHNVSFPKGNPSYFGPLECITYRRIG
jgi:hypothetical protein